MHPLETYLKEAGLDVQYHHYRYAYKETKDGQFKCTLEPIPKHEVKRNWVIFNFGGKTEAVIQDSEGNEISSGTAVCSLTDNFCRATGRDIALKRAYEACKNKNNLYYKEMSDATMS